MNEQTKKELMAFMEGEMGPLQANRMAARLQGEQGLRDAWENQYRVSFCCKMTAPGRNGLLPDLPTAWPHK